MERREGDDDYGRVVARLGTTYRVIACRDDLQWIVQERMGNRWRSLHYCTSREGVLRRVKGLPGWESLSTLPDRFRSGKSGALTVARARSPNRPVSDAGELETVSGHAA